MVNAPDQKDVLTLAELIHYLRPTYDQYRMQEKGIAFDDLIQRVKDYYCTYQDETNCRIFQKAIIEKGKQYIVRFFTSGGGGLPGKDIVIPQAKRHRYDDNRKLEYEPEDVLTGSGAILSTTKKKKIEKQPTTTTRKTKTTNPTATSTTHVEELGNVLEVGDGTPDTSSEKENNEPQNDGSGYTNPNRLPNSQTIVKPLETRIDEQGSHYLFEVGDYADQIEFSLYPDEITQGSGWFVNHCKIPLNDEAVLNILPSFDVLEDKKGNGSRYLGKWKDGSLCRGMKEALSQKAKIREKYYEKYPDQAARTQKFGLGIVSKYYPKYMFFECDDAWKRDEAGNIIRSPSGVQEMINTTYNQVEFFKHCIEQGYHVGRSASGNMHYVFELPDHDQEFMDVVKKLSEKEGGFKLMQGKEKKEDEGEPGGDFELGFNHNSQWNETGYVLNEGKIIPKTDKVTRDFILARMKREVARNEKTSYCKYSKISSSGALSNQPHVDGGVAEDDDQIDNDQIIFIMRNATGKLKRLLHSLDVEKKRHSYDLSTYLQSLANLLRLQGVKNYATFYSLAERSALHRVYQERPDGKEKWHEEKLKRTWETACNDINTDCIFRTYKNKEGETRKEIMRAIKRFEEISNPIFYSQVERSLVKLQNDGNFSPINADDLICEITTNDFTWINENGEESLPTNHAIRSCISAANIPTIFHRRSGGWITTEGEIVKTKGYHDGIYLDKDIEVRPIPDDIQPEHLRQAHDIIEHAFRNVKFQYKDGLDDVVYSLGIMFLHPSIKRGIPLIIINKNKAGIGASTLVSGMFSLVHNTAITEPIALYEEEIKTRDVMTAALSPHDNGYANFDNLRNTACLGVCGLMLHSGSGSYNDRMKYGKTVTSIDTRKDMLYNGNNVVITADYCRRALEIRLFWEGDTTSIKFGKNMEESGKVLEEYIEYVSTKHSEVLWAFAVGLNAWLRSGKPYPKTEPTGNWSEYGRYHKYVGGMLDMLGFTHYLQHLEETQRINNYVEVNYVEKIEVLHNAFISSSGQGDIEGHVEYEGRDFCAGDLYRAMNPTRDDLNLLKEELMSRKAAVERGNQEKADKPICMPATYSQELKRLFGESKGKNLTMTLDNMVNKGVVSGTKYQLIRVVKTTGGVKWFRVVTQTEYDRKKQREERDNSSSNS